MEMNYTCPHTGAVLVVKQANMDALRKLLAELQVKRPPPKPPIVKIRTFETVELGLPDQEIEDLDDEGYKAARNEHNRILYSFTQNFFWRTCLVIKTTEAIQQFTKIISSAEARVALFDFIRSNSELTQDAVLAAKARMGFVWQGVPLHEIPPKTSHGGMPLQEVSYNAAAKMYMMPPWEVDKMTFPEQAEMVARYSLLSQLSELEAEHRRKEAEKERSSTANQPQVTGRRRRRR